MQILSFQIKYTGTSKKGWQLLWLNGLSVLFQIIWVASALASFEDCFRINRWAKIIRMT